MADTTWQEPRKSDLIDRVVRCARLHAGDEDGVFSRFLRRYFARVPFADLEHDTPESLLALAAAHLRLAEVRPPATPLVHVFNPQLDGDGWQGETSVLQIVTDDMPFLVDLVAGELGRRAWPISRVIHPIFRMCRDDAGHWLGLADDGSPELVVAESFIHIDLARQPADRLTELAQAISDVLECVRTVVADREAMVAMLRRVRVATAAGSWPGAGENGVDPLEIAAFLDWLAEGNFTFLGYRALVQDVSAEGVLVQIEPGSGLGLLRGRQALMFEEVPEGQPLPPMAATFVEGRAPLTVTKASRSSPVHRCVPMDVIVVKRFDADGRVLGAHVFAGLFTAQAYEMGVRNVPLLRRKLAHLLASAGIEPLSHDGRALAHIVQTLPRDELFQVDDEALLRVALGILDLQHRPRPALFLRVDDFKRYVHALIFVPRDRYSTSWRERVQALLERSLNGTITAHYALVGNDQLARLQVFVKTTPGAATSFDESTLEAELAAASRSWSDDLSLELVRALGEDRGQHIYRRYRDAFPAGYCDRSGAEAAVDDIALIEAVLAGRPLGLALTKPPASAETQARLKVVHADTPIHSSDLVPLLENLGWSVIDEVPHAVRPAGGDGRQAIVHELGLATRSGDAVNVDGVHERFEQAFSAVWSGAAEDDGLGALILSAGLDWRQIAILRAYVRYLRQARIGFGQAYLTMTLLDQPAIAAGLVGLFEAMFDPECVGGREDRIAALDAQINTRLETVASADQDRILRRLHNAIACTLRTNAFQRDADGERKTCLAVKLDSRRLDELPLPRPLVEIFVCSPRLEGVHLRGGRVARGGLRWSDRREDFRTEVLGLMKAQMVKNAVIVPTGAKGGFFVKSPPEGGDRAALQAEGIACYRAFIGALLDVTDTVSGGRIVPPADVVRRDEDDPYLVVAADKGTATFSDIANALAVERGFWLGDAFASGGSQGYDHKRMGITARGAFASVERHFREAGIPLDAPFSVAGVGDMSGDVFGNGVLLSPNIRLIAAFDHRHIFIDPDPDPQTSFAERRRLFELPQSSWAEYDPAVLSAGGGVFQRTAKSIPLSDAARARFGVPAGPVRPVDLLRAVLKADVDLLWFGGIGTYVKATAETHGDVGDRANDAIRINGRQLRARVIGEGANLGLTQRGRIEYAEAGGRLNTDFIDNSAGVDCSDHEVNIKILLDGIVGRDEMTAAQRNRLLVEMTDDVAALVLRDNDLQTRAISLIEAGGTAALDRQARFIRRLERQDRLDRDIEFLPDDEALASRTKAGQGLTRPEIAVLFSYAKIWLREQVLGSALPDETHLADDVAAYFPMPIRERFPDEIERHPLRRELAAMLATNAIIDRVGMTYVADIAETMDASPVTISRAYLAVRHVFGLQSLWRDIEVLEDRLPATVTITMHRAVRAMIERTVPWFVRHGYGDAANADGVAAFDLPIAMLRAEIRSVLPASTLEVLDERAAAMAALGVPVDLAAALATLVPLTTAGDIVHIAAGRGEQVTAVARVYFAVGERFGFDRLRERADGAPADSHWQRLALAAAVDELDDQQRRLTEHVLAAQPPGAIAADDETEAVAAAIDAWCADDAERVDTTLASLSELQGSDAGDLAVLTIGVRRLRMLTDA